MDAIGARSRGQESMHRVNRLLEKAADTVALDSGEKFFEGIAIGRKQILPNGRVSLLVDNLEYPISLCTGWPVYAENHHHVVVDKFAGEFRKLVLLFIIRHGALYHKWPCRATGACVQSTQRGRGNVHSASLSYSLSKWPSKMPGPMLLHGPARSPPPPHDAARRPVAIFKVSDGRERDLRWRRAQPFIGGSGLMT